MEMVLLFLIPAFHPKVQIISLQRLFPFNFVIELKFFSQENERNNNLHLLYFLINFLQFVSVFFYLFPLNQTIGNDKSLGNAIELSGDWVVVFLLLLLSIFFLFSC